MANLLVRRAKICEKNGDRQVDVLIAKGKIVGVYPVGMGMAFPKAEVIDAFGCYVFPGGIDPHIHSRYPGGEHKEDIEHLRRAAWRGGTTSVCDMPNTNPPMIDRFRLSVKTACLEGHGLDFRYWLGSDGYNMEEIDWAVSQKDIVGIKLYLASKNLPGPDEAVLRKIFRKCADKGLIISVHSESKEVIDKNFSALGRKPAISDHSIIRNKEAEIVEVKRVIRLAKEFKARVYFCHLTTREAARLVLEEKRNGLPFFIEFCPHHLILDDELLKKGNGKLGPGYFKVVPPLRGKKEVQRLITVLISGWIDTIGSDHVPHAREEKERQEYGEIPNGLPGVEYRIPLMWQFVAQGWITPKQFEELISGNAAKIFGLKDRGEIVVGKKADLFLLNPSKKWKITGTLSKCGWTPYEGFELQGDVVMTIKNGEIVYDGR